MLIYPSKSEIDAWEKLGNSGWNWEALSTHFRTFHTLTQPFKEAQDNLALSFIADPIQQSFRESGAYTAINKTRPKTFQKLNRELIGNPASVVSKGDFTNQSTVNPVANAGAHARSEYLTPEVVARRILTEVLVRKIVLNKSQNGGISAQGVTVITKKGEDCDILAAQEVFLTAGTIKAQKLLELYSVGDSKLLKYYGMVVLIDNLNVGENLQDYGYVSFSWEVADDRASGDVLRSPEMAAYKVPMVHSSMFQSCSLSCLSWTSQNPSWTSFSPSISTRTNIKAFCYRSSITSSSREMLYDLYDRNDASRR